MLNENVKKLLKAGMWDLATCGKRRYNGNRESIFLQNGGTYYVAGKSKEVSGKQRLPELEGVCNAQGWVDVCKTPEG